MMPKIAFTTASKIVPYTNGKRYINLIFWNEGDTQCTSLDGIRRYMKKQTEKDPSRGGFWERLAGNRLKNLLRKAVGKLLTQFGTTIIGAGGLGTGVVQWD